MANRIKGITVEIGGDATGLDKALKGVNSTIKSTQSQLRDVNRLLKLDPSNTKLLAQKQELLKNAISDTSEKLKSLKEADKQAKIQLENGELGKDKYDALQREIIETENNLKSLQEEAKKVPSAFSASMKEAGKSIKEFGDKTTDLGKSLSTHVTAPIIAIGAAASSAFNEVDKGMDIIVQKTGASGEQLKEMQDIMENLVSSIPTDFETAGSAVGEVNTRFGLTGQSLEDLSEKFIKFAALNNTDVSSAVDNTQKVMSAFGLNAEDAGALLDTMNAVGQRTGISMDTLAKSMVTNSASLQQLGFSASDAANFLGNVEMSGVDSSQVMTGLTKALATAAQQGKPMDVALREIQSSMVNAKTDTEGLQAAYELFGRRAGGAIYQACKNGSLSFDKLGTSLNDNLGNVENTFNETLDPIDEFKTALNGAKLVAARLGASVFKVLQPAMKKLGAILKSLKDKWDKLSPYTKELIVKIGLIVAAVGPILIIVGKVIAAIGVITSVIGGIGAVMSTSLLPMIGIIALIVAAIVAVIEIIKNWGAISEWFRQIWQSVSERVIQIWNGISSFFSELWNGMSARVSETWNYIKAVILTVINNISNIVSSAYDSISSAFISIWENCKTLTSTVWENIKTNISNVLERIRNSVSGSFEIVKNTISNIWKTVQTTIETSLNNVFNFISETFTSIKTTISNAWDGLSSGISLILTNILSNVSTSFDSMKTTISEVFENIKNIASSVWGSIKSAIISPIEFAKNKIKKILDSVQEFFSNIKLEFPHINLPHFSIKGQFSLNPPSTPYLSVDWYKQGGIMNKPTAFGMSGSSLMAGGEAGPEAILPLDSFYSRLETILDSKLNGNGAIERYLSIIADNSRKEIYLEDGALVGHLLPSIDNGLGKIAARKERGI